MPLLRLPFDPASHAPSSPPAARCQVVRELVALGIIVPTSDLLSIRRSIQYFIQNINRQAQQQEAVGVSCPR